MTQTTKHPQGRDKIKHAVAVRANLKRYIAENQAYVLGYLRDHPCVDCREPDPIVLEFDHVSGEKDRSISTMIRRVCLDRLKDEISKCVVRCANCHRRKTASSLGWYQNWPGFDLSAVAEPVIPSPVQRRSRHQGVQE